MSKSNEQVSYKQTSAMLTSWKKHEDLDFLTEVSSVPLQQGLTPLARSPALSCRGASYGKAGHYFWYTNYSVIFIEDLQIANLVRRCKAKLGTHGQFLPNGQSAKSGLNKSLQDAAFGQFIQVLEYVGWKLGKRIIKVDPKGTSQHCWECLNRVSKSLSERWHSCPRCGQELDRDYNSALLIQKIGLLSTQGEDITSVKTAVRVSLAEESRALL